MDQQKKSQSEHLEETIKQQEDTTVKLKEDQGDKDNTETTKIEMENIMLSNKGDISIPEIDAKDDTLHTEKEHSPLDSTGEDNNDLDIPLSEDQPTDDSNDQQNSRNWKPEACPETYLGCILTIPRVLVSIAIGLPLGLVPGLLYALGVILITLFRYPANFYKTFKVTIFTVMFKKRLKFLILLCLGVVQLLYPLVFVVGAVFCCLVFWWGLIIASIYMLEFPCSLWPKLGEGLKKYYELHKEFYDEYLEKYSHPSGVPLNWNGRRYDIPNFGFLQTLIGLLLTLYGVVVVPLGTIVIIIIRFPFAFLRIVYFYLRTLPDMCSIMCFPFLPFWVLGLAIVAASLPVLALLIILASPVAGLRCPYIALTHNCNVVHGIKEALNLLIMLDASGYELLPIPPKLFPEVDLNLDFEDSNVDANEPDIDIYWNIFIKECTEVCHEAVEKGWINKDDVDAAMPNVLTAIPAMTVLKILGKSIEGGDLRDLIVWDENHTCDEMNKPKDDIVQFFWPKLRKIIKGLKNLSKEEHNYLYTQLCANSETNSDQLEAALSQYAVDDAKKKQVHQVSADINSLVIILLRMEKMQTRSQEFLKASNSETEFPQT